MSQLVSLGNHRNAVEADGDSLRINEDLGGATGYGCRR